ncbi:MAG: DNA-directed RNA polymerase subunit alpha, partial [Muribaculaceae bacterium]|nr:DNA-directed RNA polymerase subunit alpha [Muribaculaceae bacterium]
MAIIAFQKPDKVLMLEADNFYGKFELKPLEPGYGTTVGNALRRVLLNSLEGYAISTIKIDGVKHEFDTIPGVKEDVSGIILNLKQVNLKQTVEDTDFEKVTINVSGTQEFTAGDIGKALSGFEVMNPELVICHLDPGASFTIVLTINKGRSWVAAEENQSPNDEVDVIAIDSVYTPIVNGKYTVENFRVDQKTDYDKL